MLRYPMRGERPCMARDEEGTGDEIARCLGKLRSDVEALESSQAIDHSILRELMQIVEEIEGHIEVAFDPKMRIVPD